MAYAESLERLWIIYAPGVLQKAQTVCTNHIASPDVNVDDTKQEIRMYFRGQMPTSQLSFLAQRRINFHTRNTAAGIRVFRGIPEQGLVLHGDVAGRVYRSKDGVPPFEEGPERIQKVRHSAAKVDGDALWPFYSKIGDAPELIEVVLIDLTRDWQQWTAAMSSPQVVLKPELDYESVNIPIAPSNSGKAENAEHALRDPGIFEEDGLAYLIYSVAGERGLGISELLFK